MADNSKLEALLEQSIQAQNRTTHAVRAIATYILIQVAWGLVAGILLVLGAGPSLQGQPVLSIFGLLCLVVGFFHAFLRAMSELSLSADGVSSSELKTDEPQAPASEFGRKLLNQFDAMGDIKSPPRDVS